MSAIITSFSMETTSFGSIAAPKRRSRAKKHSGWHEFETGFNQRHPNFLSRLAKAFPALSITELHICAMLRESFSSFEIAEALSVTERTVENHRSLIRRKLGVMHRLSLPMYLLAL
jgi:DNA-binding CsgD family transcriptional regulator